jgi:predicted nucleic acid-binding protein
VNKFYLDASDLGKRYAPEAGSPLVNYLFGRVSPDRLAALSVGIVEVASILVRKRNRGHMTYRAAAQALTDFGSEIVSAPIITKLEVTNLLIPRAIALVARHSVNSTDALVLLTALDLAGNLRAVGDDVVLVASDHQLLKAARAEGLTTFDPATQSQADLDALIGP